MLFLNLLNVLLLILTGILAISCEKIGIFDVTEGSSTTNEHHTTFELINNHLEHQGKLRFSAHGTRLSQITHLTKSKQNFSVGFTDQTEIHVEQLESLDANVDQFKVTWHGAGPSLQREICFHYGFNNASWYSTYEEKEQHFPMSNNITTGILKSFTTADFLQTQFGNIIEHLFLTSDGFAIFLDEHHPWFLRRNPNQGDPIMCVGVSNESPYSKLTKYDNPAYLDLIFHIRTAKNVKLLWKSFVNVENKHQNFLGFNVPTGIPDVEIFKHPIWSTWARYKKGVTETKVKGFAAEVTQHGFPHAQLEIDDKWEVHYGDMVFDKEKFPDAKKMITDLHHQGYRVTLWVYPFINNDSSTWEANKARFVQDHNGQPLLTKWWNGIGSLIDFTNPDNANWFVQRLHKLQNETGIDSFKFDAGEMNWYGKNFTLHSHLAKQYPNLATTAYVETCAKLGGAIEVRAGFKSQSLPVFVRMMDKQSTWTFMDGLKSLIPVALTMSIAGYPFNLPDMIGGNGHPEEELLIRWIQANTFLPSMQFSVPPWSFGERVTAIAKKAVVLHEKHAETFINLAKRTNLGEPILRPMWYAEPEDSRTFKIGDQFMVGDDIVVAPVIEFGAHQRTVYFPTGVWLDQHGKTFTGPSETLVQAPINELPYFVRKV